MKRIVKKSYQKEISLYITCTKEHPLRLVTLDLPIVFVENSFKPNKEYKNLKKKDIYLLKRAR